MGWHRGPLGLNRILLDVRAEGAGAHPALQVALVAENEVQELGVWEAESPTAAQRPNRPCRGHEWEM